MQVRGAAFERGLLKIELAREIPKDAKSAGAHGLDPAGGPNGTSRTRARRVRRERPGPSQLDDYPIQDRSLMDFVGIAGSGMLVLSSWALNACAIESNPALLETSSGAEIIQQALGIAGAGGAATRHQRNAAE